MKPTTDRIDRGLYWDRAWSLVEGCSPVSAACDNCWAAKAAHMRRNHPNIHISMDNSGITNEDGRFNGVVRLRHDLLDLPLTVKKPTVWAVWTDLFHGGCIPMGSLINALNVIEDTPHHTYLLLTKRPVLAGNLFIGMINARVTAKKVEDVVRGDNPLFLKAMSYLRSIRLPHLPLSNLWLGVTAENQQSADERISLLRETPAAKRFVSAEPTLGPVDITRWIGPDKNYGPGLDWIICGGETGLNARPMNPDWARSLRDQCKAAGVPFFFKGWGAHIPAGQEKGNLDGEVIREFPE